MGFLVGRRLNGDASPLRRGVSPGSEWLLEYVGLGSALRERGRGGSTQTPAPGCLGTGPSSAWQEWGLAGAGGV